MAGSRRKITAAGMVWMALAAAGCLGLTGCLFAPREAESPASGQEIIYLPPSEAENVLDNTQTALNALDSGGYDDVISETFQYEPDTDTQAAWPGVDWDNWNATQEEGFAARLFQNVNKIQMDLRDSTINVELPSGTEAEYDLIYFLKVTDLTGETRYRGRAELTFKLIGSSWYIDKWVDLNQEGDPETGADLPTMGSLRGALASK
jgi:hypothetical protein